MRPKEKEENHHLKIIIRYHTDFKLKYIYILLINLDVSILF